MTGTLTKGNPDYKAPAKNDTMDVALGAGPTARARSRCPTWRTSLADARVHAAVASIRAVDKSLANATVSVARQRLQRHVAGRDGGHQQA